MRICTNQGVGQSDPVPFNNETGRDRVVLAWGTVTAVNLELSPDGGTTWVAVQSLNGGGSFIVPLGGEEDYEIRVNVTTGAGVFVDVI